MNVGIISSSNEEIDAYYKSIARSISNYLAKSEFNLVFGGCSTSMMGICYQEFIKYDRKVLAITTLKYASDLENLRVNTESIVSETTFDLKKEMFNNSDIIIALPGGVGTYSEVLSFIEEKRSNDKTTPIEIYDEDGYFLPLIKMLEIMVDNKFVGDDIFNYFKVSHNREEFENHIMDYIYNKKGNKIK